MRVLLRGFSHKGYRVCVSEVLTRWMACGPQRNLVRNLTHIRIEPFEGCMELPPFQVLLDSYGHDIHGFLVAGVGAGDADDCYQETWIAALRAYPRLRHTDNLRGWLLTIAARKAIDLHRARGRAPIPVGELPEPRVEADTGPGRRLGSREGAADQAAVSGRDAVPARR